MNGKPLVFLVERRAIPSLASEGTRQGATNEKLILEGFSKLLFSNLVEIKSNERRLTGNRWFPLWSAERYLR
ncbi:MAG: hypothetical protein A2252_06675 [Elusimicrobia bacterium RIFOXYA2_FULL_39_19]|nr:MAG: hypothetical protein A2252_06675 [Elusimicrobia bacterium RIFOXYA2_FULL_39_19]